MAAQPGAVLLMGFGGPASFDEVRPFILNVVHGRSVSRTRIDEVVEQYRAIGGKSPFLDLTRQQAKALESRLSQIGLDLPVYVGTQFCTPYIGEAIEQMASAGIRHAVGITMAPHRTEASFDRYVQTVEASLARLDDRRLTVDFVQPWHTHPLFIEAVADRIRPILGHIPSSELNRTQLLFTAHSIPEQMAIASSYVDQIDSSARLVAQKLNHQNWTVAYQSRSGNPTEPWLEPDIRDIIPRSAKEGIGTLLVVPIGFLCDHVEVLFDLDVQARSIAEYHHLTILRSPTVSDHPCFIELLAQLVEQNIPIGGCPELR